jgi:hypothetical protein
MPERNGYIPGVPCWVDTSQPDPEAAVDFYGGLFGWEFQDMTRGGSEGTYFIARCETTGWSRPRRCGTPTSGLIAPTRPRPRFARPAEAS